MENDETFDIDIDVSRLPNGWTVKQPYETSIRIHAPNGPEHIIIQDISETGSEYNFLVEPMVKSDVSGASTENSQEYAMQFVSKKNTIEYAITVADEMHHHGL